MKSDIYFLSYLAQFFLEWEMFKKTFVQEIKTHIFMFSNDFLQYCRL
jgi:hypothetical protein